MLWLNEFWEIRNPIVFVEYVSTKHIVCTALNSVREQLSSEHDPD